MEHKNIETIGDISSICDGMNKILLTYSDNNNDTLFVLNDKEHNSKLKDNLFKGTSVEEISENKKYKDFYDFVHNDVKADTKASDLIKLFECLKNK